MAIDHAAQDPNRVGTAVSQKILLAQLQAAYQADRTSYHIKLNDFGFRCFSEFEEDGLLLFIFAAIGFSTKRVVEICAGDGTQCMATNLIINHGFHGLLFDGNENHVATGRKFFAQSGDTFLHPPEFKHAWITTDNINDLISQAGFSGEIDLLSMDIDGNDYWIWKAIEVIQPRVCIFETQNTIPSELSLTIPYTPDFYCWDKGPVDQEFRSVSLLAMTKLSREKGYRLIGGHRHGFNVIFLRNDIGAEIFPEVEIAKIHDNPATRRARAQRWPLVKEHPWVAV